jgi:hypothetical protein
MKVLPSYNALTSYTASSAVWLMRDIGKENLAKKVDRVEFEPTTSARVYTLLKSNGGIVSSSFAMGGVRVDATENLEESKIRR